MPNACSDDGMWDSSADGFRQKNGRTARIHLVPTYGVPAASGLKKRCDVMSPEINTKKQPPDGKNRLNTWRVLSRIQELDMKMDPEISKR